MYLKELTLRHFRNFSEGKASFSSGLTVVWGANAQGKTNLLEAVHMLSHGKSHRANRDNEMIEFGHGEALIEGSVVRPSGTFSLSVLLYEERRKQRLKNGKTYRAGQDPLGDLHTILFCPEDLFIVKGSPSERRRFLDQDLGQVYPNYRKSLHTFQKSLAQRNQLLKRGDVKLLGAFTEGFLHAGIELTRWRKRMIEDIAPFVKEAYARVAPGDPSLEVYYQPGLPSSDEKVLYDELARRRDEEVARGISVLGPHRDDMVLTVGDNEVRTFGSQGQNRTVAIALKVGALAFVRDRTESSPVLLLDDVLSELDEDRRGALSTSIHDGQTLLTTTDPLHLPQGLERDRLIHIDQGRIVG